MGGTKGRTLERKSEGKERCLLSRSRKEKKTKLPFSAFYHLISEMRRFLVDRASIENVNVVQQEAELEPPPNVFQTDAKLVPNMADAIPQASTLIQLFSNT
ncbi:hypothetical protein JHK85_004520 [Glycine max]|nr:hypothetical protein JHK85_004520 [Glycine max]